MRFHIKYLNVPSHRDLDTSVFVSFPEIYFVLIMYYTLSHMVGHVTSSANDQLYTIKINKDFLMRLLKRGDLMFETFYVGIIFSSVRSLELFIFVYKHYT